MKMITDTEVDNKPPILLENNLPSSSNNAELLPQNNSTMPLLEQSNNVVESKKVLYVKKSLSKKAKRRLKYCGIVLLVFIVLCFLFTFIGVPIIFMSSIELQRLIMFTHWGLPSEKNYFRKYELRPGLRNLYVTVHDLNNKDIVSLGVWHLLPYTLQGAVITEENFDFDKALKNSSTSILLYFHGTGEDRSSSLSKYSVFRYFFHVITFDYRSYGDSSKSVLSEDAVVNDCVQLYEWLTTKTSAPILIWGHSLGSALAARTVATLQNKSNNSQPIGLILESAFTKMSEELYVHPYGKIFAWLPWFAATVVRPLEKNGFVFDTAKHISNVTCPIMILSSEDDSIVPYKFGEKLDKIAQKRTLLNTTLYYQFAYNLDYDHFFMYKDPFVPYFINYFLYICLDDTGWDSPV